MGWRRRISALSLVFCCCGEVLADAREPEVRLGGELSFWLGDDDAFRPTENAVPASPAPSFGERARYALAVDTLAPAASRLERALILELGYRAESPLLEGLSTRALVRAGLFMPEAPRSELTDQGSFLELGLARGESRDALRLYPVAGDRIRLGFSEALSWGGEVTEPGDSPYARAGGVVPAAVIEHDEPRWGAHAGLKTALGAEPTANGFEQRQVLYGALGGARLRLTDWIELAAQAGYLKHGAMPQPDVRGEALETLGASFRLVLQGGPGAPEPLGLFAFARPARVGSRPRFALALEGTALALRLKLAGIPRALAWVPARAGALFGGVEVAGAQLVAGALLRELEFVTRQGPGLLLPEASTARSRPEWTAFVGARLELAEALIPGLDFTLQSPAASIVPGLPGEPAQLLLVRGPRDLTPLRPGRSGLPVLEARGTLGCRLSPLLAAVAFAQYRRDPNALAFERSSTSASWTRASLSSHSFGYGIAVRAKF